MGTMNSVLEHTTIAHPECDDVRMGTATCRCGQDLDLYVRSHCPRCGTLLGSH